MSSTYGFPGIVIAPDGTVVVPRVGAGALRMRLLAALPLRSSGAEDGLLTVFLAHTSASLTIQENADPDVQGDLLDALSAERGGAGPAE